MKWIALLAFILAVVPLTSWAKKGLDQRTILWTLLGFLSFLHGPLRLYVAPISWAGWPGYVEGIEVSFLDFLAVSLFLATKPSTGNYKFSAVFTLYIIAVLVSVVFASMKQPALFYAWQLAKIFFLSFVISRGVSRDFKVAIAIMNGLAIAMVIALASAGWDRFVTGALQSGGALGHQNTLGMMSYFVTFPFLALLLGGLNGWRPWLVPPAGLLIAAVTVSRATIGLTLVGYLLTFAASAAKGWSARKTKALAAGVFGTLLLAPLALPSIEARLNRDQLIERQQASAADERRLFEKAAALMFADNPAGVGANHYVLRSNVSGYADRAGIVPTAGSRAAHVHNLFWLVLAETSYYGLVALLLFLFHPLVTAIRVALKGPHDNRRALMLGMAVALTALYAHSLYEWIFVSFQVQYVFGVALGIISGTANALAAERRSLKASRRASSRSPQTVPAGSA
jgi:hypothetical protein